MTQKWFRKLFRQRVFVILSLIIQMVFLLYAIINSSITSDILNGIFMVISLLVCLYIISRQDKGAYKLSWVFLILLFPVFGGLLYLMCRFQSPSRKASKKLAEINEKMKDLYRLPGSEYERANIEIEEYMPQIEYLENYVGFPVYADTETKYLSPGEMKLEYLLKELEKAEKYIFLEYFIVQEGEMWNSILDVLIRKVKEGVKVRLIYDDMGCFFLLPKDYAKKLRELGIECVVFNEFRPFLTTLQNNRDHRKIVSIDGKIAFTGGINLADEYINAIDKHGHWKDASVMLKGKAAWSMTLMFLEMWEFCTGKEENYKEYYPYINEECTVKTNGFVQPYCDNPMDDEDVGEQVYLQIITNSKKYLYINTPYLIIDDSMVSALSMAAKSGVDVRIVTPHRWDKWFVHMTTRSYYRELIKAGVKVYEYSKGFIHSKTFVSDDTVATIGTFNMDFRSLYLHFECGVRMYNTKAVEELKDDFLETLESCQRITEEDLKCGILLRLFQDIMRIFAPLM